MKAQPRKHSHGMMEDITSSLHALIQPSRPMLFAINGYGKGLAAAIVHRVDQLDLESIRMLAQALCARHAWFSHLRKFFWGGSSSEISHANLQLLLLQ